MASHSAGTRTYGQTGTGATTAQVLAPPQSDALTGAKAVVAGDGHTCALMSTGGVRCWGADFYNQMGPHGLADTRSPPTSDFLTGVDAIAAGTYHTCALMTAGNVRCWGDNRWGQLGDPCFPCSKSPQLVEGTCQ